MMSFYRKAPVWMHRSSKLLTRTDQSCCNSVRHTRHLLTLTKTLHFKPEYKKDQVPTTYQLVYENSQGRLLAASRVLSSAAGSLGMGMSVWYLATNWAELPVWHAFALASAGMFSLAAVVSVNVIARFYLLRNYHREQEGRFIGIRNSLYGQPRQFEYSVEDIQPLARGKTKLSHSKSTVTIGDNRFHLRSADFILPKYYNTHLKFQ